MKTDKLVRLVFSGTAFVLGIIYFVLGFSSTYFNQNETTISNCQQSYMSFYFSNLLIIEWINIASVIGSCSSELLIILIHTFKNCRINKACKNKKQQQIIIFLTSLAFIFDCILLGHSVKILVYSLQLLQCTSNKILMENLHGNSIAHSSLAAFLVFIIIIRYIFLLKQKISLNQKLSDKELINEHSSQHNQNQKNIQMQNSLPKKSFQISLRPYNDNNSSHNQLVEESTIRKSQLQYSGENQKSYRQHTSSKKKPKIFGRVLNIPPKITNKIKYHTQEKLQNHSEFAPQHSTIKKQQIIDLGSNWKKQEQVYNLPSKLVHSQNISEQRPTI